MDPVKEFSQLPGSFTLGSAALHSQPPTPTQLDYPFYSGIGGK